MRGTLTFNLHLSLFEVVSTSFFTHFDLLIIIFGYILNLVFWMCSGDMTSQLSSCFEFLVAHLADMFIAFVFFILIHLLKEPFIRNFGLLSALQEASLFFLSNSLIFFNLFVKSLSSFLETLCFLLLVSAHDFTILFLPCRLNNLLLYYL